MSADADSYDSVQWYKDGVEIVGATGTTFKKENVTLEDAGKYKAVFKGSYGTLETKEATVTITVPDVPVTKVTLDKNKVELDIGGTETIKATLEPANATDKKVTWKSADSTIAKVSTAGLVTAIKEGVVVITATAKSGVSATCEVTVKPKPEPTIDIEGSGEKQYMKKGSSKTLKVTTFPEDAEWTIEPGHDTSVVKVEKI